MKKLILLLGLSIASSCTVFGAEFKYTCVEPYNMNNKVSSFFSSITGLNFTRSKISEAVIEKSINKSIKGGKLNVTLDSYSAKDLANGIFKSIQVSGKNVSIDGIYFSSLEVKSLCEFNYIEYDNKGNLAFKEDFPMSFSVQVSNDDINNTMQSEKYKKIISNINILGISGIKITSTKASVRGNKFYYAFNINIPFMKERKVELTADLKVKEGKIDFHNTRLVSDSFKLDLKKLDFLLDYINPLDFSVHVFENKNAKVYIKNITIKNNIINADGIIIIPKD